MVPLAKAFFSEVRTVYAPLTAVLGLTGPEESELVLPNAHYKGPVVEYRISLDYSEGTVGCSVELDADIFFLTVDLEPLAIALGVVEKRGGISFSARNLKQLRKSLEGQADYVRRVHPLLADAATAEDLMRRAGARQWNKGAP
ncbi:hypothetical protein [Streptomyces sp. NBC_01373]|uniref:hypothetical protein n=1 Tax=Streptomyces sp. NBC_01373 TaxID=2903843 RepID=UPI00224DF980|nr:hypothetical protein [Streptomyces sp. NBC_01373]MCX4704177.1 hypothetical protein [Streptomyces sp. NBC_01373]